MPAGLSLSPICLTRWKPRQRRQTVGGSDAVRESEVLRMADRGECPTCGADTFILADGHHVARTTEPHVHAIVADPRRVAQPGSWCSYCEDRERELRRLRSKVADMGGRG